MIATKYHSRQQLVTGKSTGDKIKETSLLVVGAGAAGNEILKNLALMGFGKLTIVDFDTIEDSNLSRTTLFKKEDIGKSKAETAAKRLEEYVLHDTPLIRGVHGNVITDIGKGEFIDHDIIVCCVDTMKARAYLNDQCVLYKKPFFEVGFREFNADITFVYPETETSPNLRDWIGYGKFDEKRNSCSGLIVKDENLEHIPTIQCTSAIAGGLLTSEIIKFLKGENTLKGKILKYYGKSNSIDILSINQSKNRTQQPLSQAIEPVEFSNDVTVRSLLTSINSEKENYFILSLPHVFLESWECRLCSRKKHLKKWKSFIYESELQFDECPKQDEKNICRTQGKKETITELHLNSSAKFLDKPLSYFGIPPRDILILQGIEGDKRELVKIMLQ